MAKVTVPDVLAGLLLAGLYLFLGLAAYRLRRIKKRGLAGHAHQTVSCAGWELLWPSWWPRPQPAGDGWLAAPLDRDGRLEIHVLAAEEAGRPALQLLRRFLQRHQARLDDWQPEELTGRHGPIHTVEGRGDWQQTQRAYLWLARVPGAGRHAALLLFYRASVLYGLADGYWLGEVATRARETEAGASG